MAGRGPIARDGQGVNNIALVQGVAAVGLTVKNVLDKPDGNDEAQPEPKERGVQ